MSKSKRQQTKLESTGAEYLVIGHLLIERIQAFKSPENNPSYDVIATSPELGSSIRIQVKSRWATNFDGGFPIKNFDNEFVVLAALNRGIRWRKKLRSDQGGKGEPIFYVLPTKLCKKYKRASGIFGWKVFLKDIPNFKNYQSNWELINQALGMKAPEQGHARE